MSEGAFSENDLQRLEYHANYVFIGIRSAQLNEELQTVAHDQGHKVLREITPLDSYS